MEENILCLLILPLMTGLTQPCDSLHHFEGSCENGVAPEWVQAATRKKMTGCAWGTGRLRRRIILCACLPAFISSSNTSLKTSQGKSFTVPFISQLGRKGYLFQKVVDSGVFWQWCCNCWRLLCDWWCNFCSWWCRAFGRYKQSPFYSCLNWGFLSRLGCWTGKSFACSFSISAVEKESGDSFIEVTSEVESRAQHSVV